MVWITFIPRNKLNKHSTSLSSQKALSRSQPGTLRREIKRWGEFIKGYCDISASYLTETLSADPQETHDFHINTAWQVRNTVIFFILAAAHRTLIASQSKKLLSRNSTFITNGGKSLFSFRGILKNQAEWLCHEQWEESGYKWICLNVFGCYRSAVRQ